MEGGEATAWPALKGMGGGVFADGHKGLFPRQIFIHGGAGRLAGWMPANWHDDCPHGREVRISSRRDSEAAGGRTRRCYL
jgi:hypothetical protein